MIIKKKGKYVRKKGKDRTEEEKGKKMRKRFERNLSKRKKKIK